MNFRTELSLKQSPWNINLKDPILTAGSCFADSIGEKFITNKFKAIVNPFGATYHPLSIHRTLKYAAYQDIHWKIPLSKTMAYISITISILLSTDLPYPHSRIHLGNASLPYIII